jgi:uncharacterized protein with HEPN domain
VKKDDLVYIEHILDSISRIKEYTVGMVQADFFQSKLVQDAVIRNLEVIGEAVKNIQEEVKIKNPHIEWKRMAGMRDKLIHHYMGVDLGAVWAVVEKLLSNLEWEMRQILEDENTP